MNSVTIDTPQSPVSPDAATGTRAVSLTVPPHFKIPAFEGPLDLLLHLIRAHEVDIYNIPIAEITRQYLDYMELWESLDLTIAGEYVLIAATLIEIKSRLLLPQPKPENPEEEPEDPRQELVQRLLEYQQYQGTLETLRGWEEQRRSLYFRGAAENLNDYMLPIPAGEATGLQLYQALHRLLVESGVDERPVTSVTPRKRLSLRLKMIELARRIERAGAEGILFDDLFELPCPRYDIVLAFLALLELLRHGRIRCEQKAMHASIWLFFITEGAAL